MSDEIREAQATTAKERIIAFVAELEAVEQVPVFLGLSEAFEANANDAAKALAAYVVDGETEEARKALDVMRFHSSLSNGCRSAAQTLAVEQARENAPRILRPELSR